MPVTFHAPGSGASLQVQGGNLGPRAGACASSCTLELLPGKYTIYLSSPKKSTWLAVDLREPSDVVVSSGDGVRRGVGLALMLAGGTLFLVGASLVYTDVRQRIWAKTDASELPYHTPDWFLPVEIAGGFGLAAALFGLPFYLSGQPSVRVSPTRAPTAAESRARIRRSRFAFAPAVEPRGGGLRLGWSF